MRNLRSIAGAPGARFALLVGALALSGLLSMHGWGTHAGMHPETSQTPAYAMVLDDHSPDAGAAGQGLSTDREDASCGGDCGGSGSDSGMDLIGVCLAVLAAMVLGLALLLIRRRIRMLSTMLPAFAHPVLLSRDRDSPSSLRLCVIRC